MNKGDLSSKRRKKSRGKGFFYLVIFGLLVAGVIFLMRIDFWMIKEVKVSETKRVNGAVLRDIAKRHIAGVYLGIFPKNNFLIYPKEEIENEILDREPAVLKVEVNADLNHALTIDIKERLAFAHWCRNSSDCYLLDEGGIVFARAAGDSALLRYSGLIEGNPLGKRFGEENFLKELSLFVENLKELGLPTTLVSVVDKDQAQMYFEDNSYLMFLPFEKEKEVLFESLALFINDLRAKNDGSIPPFEYIDARYGNKIFFKIKE